MHIAETHPHRGKHWSYFLENPSSPTRPSNLLFLSSRASNLLKLKFKFKKNMLYYLVTFLKFILAESRVPTR